MTVWRIDFWILGLKGLTDKAKVKNKKNHFGKERGS